MFSNFSVSALTSVLALLAALSPANAGQLFPPNNIGSNPNVSCPHGQLLSWRGDHVDCTDPTPGVTVSCPAGQVLNGINNGSPVCVVASGTGATMDTGWPDIIRCGEIGSGWVENFHFIEVNQTTGEHVYLILTTGSTSPAELIFDGNGRQTYHSTWGAGLQNECYGASIQAIMEKGLGYGYAASAPENAKYNVRLQ